MGLADRVIEQFEKDEVIREQQETINDQGDRIGVLERSIQHFVNLHPQYRAYFASATGIRHSEGAAA